MSPQVILASGSQAARGAPLDSADSRRHNLVSSFWIMNRCFSLASLALTAVCAFSCGSANPNIGRVLTSISVTPAAADAQQSANGQVVFTATGIFSLPPSPAVLSVAPPYSGQFVVANPVTGQIATVVSTGNGTVTVQCVAGASGTVEVVASASANNGSTIVISGNGLLTCP